MIAAGTLAKVTPFAEINGSKVSITGTWLNIKLWIVNNIKGITAADICDSRDNILLFSFPPFSGGGLKQS